MGEGYNECTRGGIKRYITTCINSDSVAGVPRHAHSNSTAIDVKFLPIIFKHVTDRSFSH